mgnify:CR=1 FL=1
MTQIMSNLERGEIRVFFRILMGLDFLTKIQKSQIFYMNFDNPGAAAEPKPKIPGSQTTLLKIITYFRLILCVSANPKIIPRKIMRTVFIPRPLKWFPAFE